MQQSTKENIVLKIYDFTLLSYGGVAKYYFVDLLTSALEGASVVNSNMHAAFRGNLGTVF